MVPSRRNGPSSTFGGATWRSDEIEQRLHAVVLRALEARRHPALLGRAVEDREIELLVGGVERGEQVEHLVDHLDRARVGAVDLVDDDDGLEPDLERLRHHELGLRQRAFGGVDQHQRAVDHVEDALDLAAEIGVAGRVDDVDAGVLPEDRGRLGEDGDAALALEVVGIHGALGHALVLAEGAGLLQQPVDQRGLAMVDMGDDGDVAKISLTVPKTKRGPQRISGRKSVFQQRQQDCRTAILWTRNPTLLRRNIVCKRPEATAPLATFRAAAGAGTYWRNASLPARIYPYRTKCAKTSRRGGADDADDNTNQTQTSKLRRQSASVSRSSTHLNCRDSWSRPA